MSTPSKRVLAVIMAIQAIFVGGTFRTSLPVLVFASLAAFVIIYRARKIQGKARSVGESSAQPTTRKPFAARATAMLGSIVSYLLLIALVAAWRIPKDFDNATNLILFGTDFIAHACLFAGFVAWAFHPVNAHKALLPLGLVVILLSVAAGGASQSAAAQATVGLGTCLGFAFASQIIIGISRGTKGRILGRRFVEGNSAHAFRVRWVGPILFGLTLSAVLMGTSVVASTLNFVLPSIQISLHENISDKLDAVHGSLIFGGTRYVRGSRLGMVRRHMLADPNATSLRVISEVKPGYLRGHAFDAYRRRRWLSVGGSEHSQSDSLGIIEDRAVEHTGTGSGKLRSPLRKPLLRFPLVSSSDERIFELEVRTIPQNGPMVFVPLNTRWIEARGESLDVTRHNTVRSGVNPNLPYVVGVGLRSLPEELEDPHRAILMDVPDTAKASVNQLVASVVPMDASPRKRASAISRHFQKDFTYSLEFVNPPEGVDPLVHFLEAKHPAHCEYFASATVLALRAAGIPSRYVTGYIVDEFDNDDDFWLARNNDAHAWAEAYDEDSKEWFPVESTPGQTYQSISAEQETNQSESFFSLFSSSGPDKSDSMFGSFAGWLLSMRVTDPLLVLLRLVQLPLFFFLVFVLWTKYLRPSRDGVDPIDQQSRKMLRKADWRARRKSYIRKPSETLHQFADRIEMLPGNADPELERLANWYRQYAESRYRGMLPQPLTA